MKSSGNKKKKTASIESTSSLSTLYIYIYIEKCPPYQTHHVFLLTIPHPTPPPHPQQFEIDDFEIFLVSFFSISYASSMCL